jgi:hypothetical protein
MSTKPRNKYHYFNISMPQQVMIDVRKECFRSESPNRSSSEPYLGTISCVTTEEI